MRDLLIEHLDNKAVPIVRAVSAKDDGLVAQALAQRCKTMAALLNRGLLRTDGKIRARATIITETGRAELAEALADWADALSRSRWTAGAMPFPPREEDGARRLASPQ